ncbi:3-phosphoshikimate 1-carboxyvinyltransferase [Desulfatitalea alkaliphila]|uniref:3-phosphoshikimate 1-carboxyvinyltransferase n=1 Tax=Desulfatitalea alkaliphila TaxID=2929485 RepID=A0AA41R480_9BACT|nr:3-phosphoshikimate 1-carboxyvinyltransferase [Desulfatitalea alkaliphila]MCJ8500486.1 3-phosphoshikimate 1-carboxyvinyltransferase [Desulfatitalea alkaliphila]
MIPIACRPMRPAVTIGVPGSKSYTHRLLIAAALSDGPCRIANPLRSDDTLLTLAALGDMGVPYRDDGAAIHVQGVVGRLAAHAKPIDLGNSGTSMRLLSGVAILGQGEYCFTGTPRMQQRPMQPLLDSLNQLGVAARSRHGNGCPPILIPGGVPPGRHTTIDCGTSSQYLSALLLAGPCLPDGLNVEVVRGPVSQPYIDMTLDIMGLFDISVAREGYTRFEVPGGQTYHAGDHAVEADGSQAGYFWAAAAITGSRIKVRGVTPASRQGDVGLAEVFGRMGCRVEHEPDGTTVSGGPLTAIDVDMGHMPDMVPTLAVVAAFARGTTTIRNVAHLRAKESDRLEAVAQELTRMGVAVQCGPDQLQVTGGRAHGAEIHTYDDHRIAMSFAVAGLKVPGVVITGENCVSKSFPDFWEVFQELYP